MKKIELYLRANKISYDIKKKELYFWSISSIEIKNRQYTDFNFNLFMCLYK